MIQALKNQFNFDLLLKVISFFKYNIVIILVLGLIAAFGRVAQLGGFGTVNSTIFWLLEVIIEGSRLLIFLFALGLSNIKKGTERIKFFFSDKKSRQNYLQKSFSNIKSNWQNLLVNSFCFLLFVWLINLFIDHIAYETCLLMGLKNVGFLTQTSSEWTILLFFKNLSVIPGTIIFETILFLYIFKSKSLQVN